MKDGKGWERGHERIDRKDGSDRKEWEDEEGWEDEEEQVLETRTRGEDERDKQTNRQTEKDGYRR